MPEFILVWIESIRDFMDLGGWVLYLIAGLLVVMWYMILDRIFYLRGPHKHAVRVALQEWEARPERSSWAAHQVREELVSSVSVRLRQYLPMIQACVALCPLFGLLGTVTGMIEVFQVMAINGTSNARAMAGGVSQATVPTMAGMVFLAPASI
jgi:biopolymer transport protein ExbB